jgi:hypothetical protein
MQRNSSHQPAGGSQRLTLLVNYWQNKTAGESFTHEMEQEELYMRYGRLVMREEHRHTLEAIAAASEQKMAPPELPVAIPATRVVMSNSHFLQDILTWQEQTLPERYAEELQAPRLSPAPRDECLMTAVPAAARNVSFGAAYDTCSRSSDPASQPHPFTGAYVFHLGRSSIADSLAGGHLDSIVNHWNLWPQHESAPDGVQIVLAGSVENSVQWRQSLPGGYDEPE